ncbi:hypothetical protein ACUY1T_06575 [Billgrantia sp. Q4P2]
MPEERHHVAAHTTGVDGLMAMSRAFNRQLGLSPGRYRRAIQAH